MGYFFIYLLIIIINIFAVLAVLKIRRNKANDANVVSDATLIEENIEKPKGTMKNNSFNSLEQRFQVSLSVQAFCFSTSSGRAFSCFSFVFFVFLIL